MTKAEAAEARVMGIRQVLSPVLDIARELRWGRVEETFGEDPYLISEMGIGFVRGFQKNGVGCMPKHFVAHGTPTGGLNSAFVVVSVNCVICICILSLVSSKKPIRLRS